MLLSYARFHAVISETDVDWQTFANSYQGNNPFQGTDVYSGPLDVQQNGRNYFSKQISKKNTKAKALHWTALIKRPKLSKMSQQFTRRM